MSTATISEVLTPVLTADDAANYLNVSEHTLANWRTKGRGLKFVKLGGIILYRVFDLNEFINDSVVEPLLDTPRRCSRSVGRDKHER